MTNVRDFPSSTQRRDLHAITSWLTNLAELTAGTVPLPDATAKIATIASVLAEEYPPAAFTRASLMHVGRQCKFFPSYGELCTHLSAWWRDHRPTPTAIAGPEPYVHVPTPERTRPTTEGLTAIRDLIARNDAFLHAQYDAIYARPGTPTAPARPKPRYLSTAELTAARQAIGAPPPKAPPE